MAIVAGIIAGAVVTTAATAAAIKAHREKKASKQYATKMRAQQAEEQRKSTGALDDAYAKQLASQESSRDMYGYQQSLAQGGAGEATAQQRREVAEMQARSGALERMQSDAARTEQARQQADYVRRLEQMAQQAEYQSDMTASGPEAFAEAFMQGSSQAGSSFMPGTAGYDTVASNQAAKAQYDVAATQKTSTTTQPPSSLDQDFESWQKRQQQSYFGG